MGLLDQVLGGLLGGGGSPLQGVLVSMLGGGNQPMGQGNAGQASAGQGGLGDLVARFEQAGLGPIIQSWIGNGANQPISPQQLQSVLGDSQVQDMARQSGVPAQDFLGQLSQHLPRAVDGMTPDGQLPDEGTVSV